MKQNKTHRILALVLVLCILCGTLQTISISAMAAGDEVPINDDEGLQAVTADISVSNEDELREAVKNSGNIVITDGPIMIKKPIYIPEEVNVTITSAEGHRYTIIAASNNDWKDGNTGVFVIQNGATVTFNSLIIHGNDVTRCINVEGKSAEVKLDYVMIEHGNSGGGNGGGVYIAGGGNGIFTVTNGCVFQVNQTSTAVPTGGGAIYVGPGWSAHISPGERYNRVDFITNKSHSGACLYAFKSYVFAEKCYFGPPSSSPAVNEASQRGGAIHSHGSVVLKDCQVLHNNSGQYGGGIYISADESFRGTVVLDNTKVLGNNAENGGGGVFIASLGTLFLRNGSSITGNNLVMSSDESLTPKWANDNNLYFSNTLGRIVLCDDSVGAVGISTANPYNRKLALFSLNESGMSELLLTALKPIERSFGYQINDSYEMEPGTYDGIIISDSRVWTMRDISSDPDAAIENPDVYTKGKIWFKINPEYDVEGANNIIFDFNLPEKEAIVRRNLKEGDTINLPVVTNEEKEGVQFKFKGWFDQPAGGERITQAITVTENMGIKVYYAQWEIKIRDEKPIPGLPQMYLVYFDQNYPGGGFTSSYNVAGSFSFDVEYTFENSEGETETGTKTITVDIPWGWPDDPYREGYDFDGWYTDYIGGKKANDGSWTPTHSVTTLYAHWTPYKYTLTWNANGGMGGGTTTQAHDETVEPPKTPPTRTGYEFTGWYLDQNCTVPLVSGTLVKGAATFYAGWTPQIFNITWDTNYTGGSVATVQQAYGSKLQIPADPVREGYTFRGWYTKPGTGQSGTKADKDYEVTGNVTFYANWTVNSYTLTWDANGGEGSTTTTQDYGTVIMPPTTPPTKTGYDFTGWYLDQKTSMELVSGSIVEGNATFYAGWTPKIYNITWDTNYTGGSVTSIKQPYDSELQIPADPVRDGYTFMGWYTQPGTGQSGTKAENYGSVKGNVTFYANWKVHTHTLTWDANSGVGSTTTTQDYGTVIMPPATPPTKTGYDFTGWYLDQETTMELVSGSIVEGDATFYAGWTPKIYNITWDTNYTGGSVTSIKQPYDSELQIPADPVRNGYTFVGWFTEPGRGESGVRAEDYGLVREDVTFYANWAEEVMDYTVTLEWDDLSDNDAVRPESITVALLRNDLPTGRTYTLTAKEADASGNKWSYTFKSLPLTDVTSREYTYSVAIVSTVSSEYNYGIENKSATLGYILMTHTLIVRDVDTYVVWDDDSNNDGIRPATVNVQLYANGKKVEDGETKVALSGSGDTWFYRFHDVQKYYTTEDGQKGQEIEYTLVATPTNPGELDGYEIEYRDYTVILRHRKVVVSRTVHVEWQDNNNQDGKRPASMMVQLYADNMPLEGKVVLLSNANNWMHTWDNLPKYADGGREVTYSARVSSTLVDYTAKSTGMIIEMTYVPSSTTISAFVTWTDENDADGLRPDYITAQLVADGKPTGDKQVLSATSGWTMTWSGYPIYKNGSRVEYTFQVDVPDGYEAVYHGVYDTSGLSAVLTHKRLTQSLTGNIVWDDRDNQSGGRMGRVAVYLCADGSVINEDNRVWISAEDGWEHTFEDLPIYRDGGKEIRYSMILASDPGKYVPSTDKMTVTMRLDPEYVDVSLQILWDDNDNSDGARPDYVSVTLLVDGNPSQYGQTATAQSDWAVTFQHLDRYGPSGLYSYTPRLVTVPTGYTATYTSPGTVVLKRVAQTKDVTATVTWLDNDNQYDERPNRVTLALYADYLDGKGPQHTGRVEQCNAECGWSLTFEGVPAYSGGKNIVYSVVASGNLPNYTISYDGLDVYMRHVGYVPNVKFTANLIWKDGHNAKLSRPYSATVTLYANGVAYSMYTLNESDASSPDYIWTHTFTDLPAKQGGSDVVYTIGVNEMPHYVSSVEGNTIVLTHTMDIPILLRWADENNNDGVRPASLSLELLGDGVKAGRTITITGNAAADTWRGVFANVPVWSDTQSDREIVYTWAFGANDLTNLGYSVDFNGYTATTIAGELAYPIDLSRVSEVADVTATLVWEDDNDRDGVRPSSPNFVTVYLYADGVNTGKAVTVSGGNEQEIWRASFGSQPVWKAGVRIQYSIQADTPAGYVVSSDSDDPLTLNMFHDPDKYGLTTKVMWDEASNKGGLDHFPITVELLVDGIPSGEVQTITYPVIDGSWGERYRYHDHGTEHVYSVRVADNTLPSKLWTYDITVEGMTITVRRVRFTLDGYVMDHAGASVREANVTLYDNNNASLDREDSDSNGYYSFILTPGTYTVQAGKNGDSGYLTGSITVTITNTDISENIILGWKVDPSDYTYTVSGQVTDSNGNDATYAVVTVYHTDDSVVGSVTADENGRYSLSGLPNGFYRIQASYSYNGMSYLSPPSDYFTISNSDTTFNILVVVPSDTEETQFYYLHGKVVDQDGNPMPGVTVLCYDEVSDPAIMVEVVTDENGEFVIRDLIPGDYKLVFSNQDGQVIAADVSYTIEPGEPYMKEVGTVVVGDEPVDGSETSGYGTLAGVAQDKDNQIVQGAQVLVLDKDTGKLVLVQETGANGAYSVLLPTGNYDVFLWRPFTNVSDQTIEVSDPAAANEDSLVSADSFTIQGTVLDKGNMPQAGVTVYLYGEGEQAVEGFARLMETVTDEDGVYTFANLAAGRYVVKIAGGIGSNGGSTDIPVTAGPLPEIPSDANLTITTDSYTVSGLVEKDGTPVHGAYVTLLNEQGEVVDNMTTGEDGVYLFSALPQGNYIVTVSFPDSELLANGEVTIESGSYVVFPGKAVSGTVKDNKGNTLYNATVTFSGEAGIYTATTGKTGVYHVAVPDGKYTVTASYQGKTAEKTVTVKNLTAKVDLTITMTSSEGTTPGGSGSGSSGSGGTGGSGSGTGGSGSGSSGVGGGIGGGSGSGGSGAGGSIGGNPADDQDETFVLSGTVLDKNGQPVEGATVTATNTKTGKTYTCTTGADGKYAMTLPVGSYAITVTYGSNSTDSKEVNVSKDTTLDDLILDDLGKLVRAYITGYPDGTFGGGNHITRSEVAALISRVSADFDNSQTYGFDFKDVEGNAWYANNLGYCVQKGLIQGRGNGLFDPLAEITRAEFAAIVARLMGLSNEVNGENPYTDITGNWAAGYIQQLTSRGIVEGKGDGKFDPNAKISRYETITMLNRVLERTPDKDVLDALIQSGTILPLQDLEAGHWAYYQVLEAAFDHYHK